MKKEELQSLYDKLTYELQTQAGWSGHDYSFYYTELQPAVDYAKAQSGKVWKDISAQFENIKADAEALSWASLTDEESRVIARLLDIHLPEGDANLCNAAKDILDEKFLVLVEKVVVGLEIQIEKADKAIFDKESAEPEL